MNLRLIDWWIADSVFWYGMTWFGIILTGTIWNFIHDVNNERKII